MALINTADNVLLGNTPVDAVYAGDMKVWPSAPVLPPYGGTDWEQRPVDWIPNTDILPGDEKIGMLAHIGPERGLFIMRYRMYFNVSTGNATGYTVDWGDGTITDYADGAGAKHTYTFSDMASYPAFGAKKQTWIIISPTVPGDTIEGLHIGFDPNTYAAAVEIIVGSGSLERLNAESLTDDTNYYENVEHVGFLREPRLTSCYKAFAGGNVLRAITGTLDTSAATNFYNMFETCRLLESFPALDTSNGTNFGEMFSSCSNAIAFPDLDTSKGTNFSAMFKGCNKGTSFPDLDTSNGTDFYQMFNGCTEMPSVPINDTSKGTRLSHMFSYCQALTLIPALDCSSSAENISMFNYCDVLNTIDAFGFSTKVDLISSNLDATALNTFFTNLGIADNSTTQQTVTITGNPGAATCDRTIATAKGWTVTA